MIATFPLYLTFLDLIKRKLCGKGSKFSVSRLLMCIQSALIRPQQAFNKCLFIRTFITKRGKLLAKNDYDKVEEQTPE
jgi:hypothetical protein